MMRIDRARLENAIYPYHDPVSTRFSDLDQLGHINNVAAAELLQEARCRFLNAFDLTGIAQRPIVVAASTIEFTRNMLWPLPIEMSVGVLDVGRTSFRLGQIARQQDLTGAYAEVVLVMRGDERAMPLPVGWHRKLDTLRIAAPAGSGNANPPAARRE